MCVNWKKALENVQFGPWFGPWAAACSVEDATLGKVTASIKLPPGPLRRWCITLATLGSCGDYGGLGWPWSIFSLGSILQPLFLFAFTYTYIGGSSPPPALSLLSRILFCSTLLVS